MRAIRFLCACHIDVEMLAAQSLTIHESTDPGIRHPNHGPSDDSGEVGALCNTVRVVRLVKEDSRDNLWKIELFGVTDR